MSEQDREAFASERYRIESMLQRFFIPAIPEGARVLSIGCGMGSDVVARRYGKAGSDCLAKGERGQALRYFRTALRVDPLFVRGYGYLALALLLPHIGTKVRHVARGVLRFSDKAPN